MSGVPRGGICLFRGAKSHRADHCRRREMREETSDLQRGKRLPGKEKRCPIIVELRRKKGGRAKREGGNFPGARNPPLRRDVKGQVPGGREGKQLVAREFLPSSDWLRQSIREKKEMQRKDPLPGGDLKKNVHRRKKKKSTRVREN